MRGSWCLCVCVCLWLLSVVVSGQLLVPTVDRISARSARLRWFVDFTAASYPTTVIQYSNASFIANGVSYLTDPNGFHTYLLNSGGVPAGTNDDREFFVNAATPITSYTLKNLNPSNSYQVRVGYFSSVASTTILKADTNIGFNTPALSSVVSLSSLLASGGCGQLTSDGSLYNLNRTTDSSSGTPTIVYSCDVVYEITNVSLAIVPTHAYATINTQTNPALTATNLTLSVTSAYVDPLTQYNTTLFLNGPGLTTNFTWNVTSESGVVQQYMLSVRRAGQLLTAKIAGPTSSLVAMIQSPAIATQFSYRGLTWSGTAVSKWKAWSDDLVTFPFTALSVSVSGSLATLSVTPATASVPDGSCSNVYVALFDTAGNSVTATTCISALNDYCSSTPVGAATKWQNPWVGGSIATRTLPANTPASDLYYPAPPTPTFPIA